MNLKTEIADSEQNGGSGNLPRGIRHSLGTNWFAFNEMSRAQFRWASGLTEQDVSPHLFSLIAARASGARTSVRRKVGWRRGVDISQRGSVPAFLRDKSRAPAHFLVGALNTYGSPCHPCQFRCARKTKPMRTMNRCDARPL